MPTPMSPVPQWSQPPSVPPQELDGADADLFDYVKLRDYLTYALHAVSRRRVAVAACTVGLTLAAVVALIVLPKSYHCEIRIRAERNVVIGTLAGMNTTSTWNYDLPTKAASALILGNDNLVALVKKTDLVHAYESTRAPIVRLKDSLSKHLSGDAAPEVKEELAVSALEKQLAVTTTDDTVTIAVDWPDARTAYNIIRAAHENFLEARQYKEISGISEAIGLLETRAADSRSQVMQALERVYKLRGSSPRKALAKKPAAPAPKPADAPLDPELKRLRAQMQSKRQVINDMEEFRRRRIAEVASKLAELKQVYSEFHPAVIELQQRLEQQERESNPQLASLREEYRQLEDEYERRGGPAFESAESLSSAPLPAEALQIGRSASEETESPEVEQAKADLKLEVGRYSSLAQRIELARAELETQRAAFPYRYGVLKPPVVPPAPDKPKKRQVLLAGLLMGFFLGLAVAVLLDIRSGKLLERWQVERQLGLPVLAEVSRR